MVYYIPADRPLFQPFQILQILKCLKDPTCAIFLKSMGFKDIEYDIPVYQMLNTQKDKYTNTQTHLHITFTHYIYTLHLHITFTHYINTLHLHITLTHGY